MNSYEFLSPKQRDLTLITRIFSFSVVFVTTICLLFGNFFSCQESKISQPEAYSSWLFLNFVL